MKVSIPLKMTIAELDRIPDDGNRYELIDGELFVSASPFAEHQRVGMRFVSSLSPVIRERDLGELFAAPLDVHLSPPGATGDTKVQPDLLFVSKERLHIVQKWVYGAPDLVIEILSESTAQTDRFEKRTLYKAAGVREYWIANLWEKTVTVYRFTVSDEPIVLSGSDKLTSPLFPGWELPVSYLFE